MSEIHPFSIVTYPFDKSLPEKIENEFFADEGWPIVYLLSNQSSKEIYIGETTDVNQRFKAHLNTPVKSKLIDAHVLNSRLFNKSITLDLEANLINYMTGDGKFKLLNANAGMGSHSYFQKNELYKDFFQQIWRQLIEKGLADGSLEKIKNAELFKLSPFKTLSADQKAGLITIIRAVLDDKHRTVFIEGGAGTGKSVLAIFFFKLLHTPIKDFSFVDFEAAEQTELRDLVWKLKEKYPEPKAAIVVPVISFRGSLSRVFSKINGLRANMVIGPNDATKKHYDILVVDESHRLRQDKNLMPRHSNVFKQKSITLGMTPHIHTELDWTLKQSDKTILFYDAFQGIKPSDVPEEEFDKLKNDHEHTKVEYLTSQFRAKGGNKYQRFVTRLLNDELPKDQQMAKFPEYDFFLFDDLKVFIEQIALREREFELCRVVAGFAWPWLSKSDKSKFDIEIGDVKLKWNHKTKDWINSKGAKDEVGCIHTVQGYDLNYAGVIFGPEIGYDEIQESIVIYEDNYKDKAGKRGVKDKVQLKTYIRNIYKTLLLRGIEGTYVYVCNDALRKHFAKYIPWFKETYTAQIGLIATVPLYSIKVAAGQFGSTQAVSSEFEQVPLPPGIRHSEDLFACQVLGESMNKKIPNGAVCLFRKYSGGSREGQIVLVEMTDPQEAIPGSSYTVKEYQSLKIATSDGSYLHTAIKLIPHSTDNRFTPIHLQADEILELKVIGIFECVLSLPQ
ncbi:hypothetical protein DCC81_15205 [Chitinophaga parva]|uniref:GIY-YIG domain-containing protein n=1 Tax=Chitinophaga parva TaxID=2169414 RepID=A0A2T7BH58_9BACT|nr:DNA/RNA helicase domain-containing protein [Chitinophaga parva]PUZ25619.1 hypothetical protein DCC81_15205 [Chitinophaga parva]